MYRKVYTIKMSTISENEIEEMFNEAKSLLNSTKKTDIPNPKNIHMCNHCNSLNTLYSDVQNGIVVCTACGVINENHMIDDTAEWSFGADEAASGGKDPARCGMPTSEFFPKSSCSTIMSGGKNKNSLMHRLHMQMSMDYVERSRYHLFKKIGNMCDSLPSTILDSTKHLYLAMADEKLSRGNVRLGLIACCILYACKQNNAPRSIKEIACMCQIEPSTVNNAHKIFQDIMKDHSISKYFSDTIEVDDLTSRYCSYLQLDRKISCQITKTVSQMKQKIDDTHILIGKTPSAITATCILYIIQKQKIDLSKKAISIKLNTSVVTLNKLSVILQNNCILFDDLF